MWQTIDDLLNFLYDLTNLGFAHGDLQPKYIKFTPNKVVKVQNPLLYTNYRNAYNFRLSNDEYKSTFAPEQLEKYEFREQFETKGELGDVFSLGICVLSVISKKDWQSFYDFFQNKVNMSKIGYELEELEQRGFSKKLITFLKASLQENP